MPILLWLPKYNWRDIIYDFFAGVAVAAMIIPQVTCQKFHHRAVQSNVEKLTTTNGAEYCSIAAGRIATGVWSVLSLGTYSYKPAVCWNTGADLSDIRDNMLSVCLHGQLQANVIWTRNSRFNACW